MNNTRYVSFDQHLDTSSDSDNNRSIYLSKNSENDIEKEIEIKEEIKINEL